MIQSSHIVFELKKPTIKENKIEQAKLQLLSAGRRSSYDLIMVLTDLNDSWTILWLEKMARTRRGKIARMCSTDVTRSLAIGFLRYHLKIVDKMRILDQTESKLDIKYDDEYKDEDDCMEHMHKKQ
jgi:1,2-phenylacetyl-CoA epoxidase catalytic subunit